MGKSFLLLDFDGLQFDTLDVHIRYINQRFKINTTPEDFRSNRLLEVAQIQRPDLGLTFYDFFSDIGRNLQTSIKYHECVEPMPGATRVIPLLSKKYVIWTVTARQLLSLPVLKYLSEKFFPGCISGFHHSYRDSGKGYFEHTSKREFLLNFTGDGNVFIDDSPYEVLSVQDIIRTYLFDQIDFHRNVTTIIHRVKSWDHIAEILL